ncbi:MAG: metallophosphoesterase [Deltaproteobacteria bacterium]|nr:metallophosphoesterase [Deltaproteobacteria bacterium]
MGLGLACGRGERAAPVVAAPPVVAPAPVAAPGPAAAPAPESITVAAGRRIVALGDLHADLGASLAALRLCGLVDGAGAWSGGDTILVQTGDITDRGPDGEAVVALFMHLQAEAPAAGGLVVPLLGNHEVMNLHGDWRYVSAPDIASFGGEAARRATFARTGPIGAWLGQRDAVLQLGGVVFAHGGVGPAFAPRGAAGLSADVRAALWTDPGAPVLGPDGPLWLRDLVLLPEAEACPQLDAALAAMGATRMVVGHTTQASGRVLPRCGGRLLAIDTGISAHYGNKLAAVELVNGDARALYPAGAEDLPDPPAPAAGR